MSDTIQLTKFGKAVYPETNITVPTILAELSDVESTAPTDGQALVWDDSLGSWKPGTVQSSVEALTNAEIDTIWANAS